MSGTESQPLFDPSGADGDAFAAALAALDDEPGDSAPDGAGEAVATPAEDTPAEPATGASAATPEPETKPSPLADLMAKAEARRAEREAKAAPAAPTGITAEQLETLMSGRDENRAAIEALKAGDLSLAAKLTGKDPASLFEGITKNGLNPGSVSAEQEIAALKAELAELKGAKPEGVVTQESFKQWQADQEREANNARFHAMFSEEEAASSFPTLVGLDRVYAPKVAQEKRLEYGARAAGLMAEAELPFTVEAAAQFAEQLAAKDLSGLASMIQGAPATNKGAAVSDHGAAADSATAGRTQAGGTIDNRAASTSASGAFDPTDLDAAFARALDVV